MDVSSEAKNYLVHRLTTIMTPIMREKFIQMYKEALEQAKNSRGHVVQNVFKVLLEEVANWNNTMIKEHTEMYETASKGMLSNILASVFICYVKMLSSTIRMSKDAKKMNITLPTNDNFVHACINNASIEFIKKMHIFRIEKEDERNEAIEEVCSRAIIKTIHDIIPINEIFSAYMTSSEHTLDFGEETKPIDLSTEEEEEPETTDEPEEADEQPPTEEEAKMIPGVPAPQPVQPAQIVQQPPPLFDDAPDQRPAQPRV
jgi:hypothetical protein